ncbi:hypothetical protein C7S13_6370 [Burkholderia cepacia]|nr:hypothetical protein [Burkholderia cepacia]
MFDRFVMPGMSRRINSPSCRGVTLSNCRNNFVTSFVPRFEAVPASRWR